MEETATFFSAYVRRPVIDATGLKGGHWSHFIGDNPDPTPNGQPGPSLPEAIQEQLGLKLEPKERGPVRVLVVATRRRFRARTDPCSPLCGRFKRWPLNLFWIVAEQWALLRKGL